MCTELPWLLFLKYQSRTMCAELRAAIRRWKHPNMREYLQLYPVTLSGCVSLCPLNTYGDYSNPNDKVCVINCASGWYSDNSTWTCVQNCPSTPSYYIETSLAQCVATCRSDLNEYALDIGRICVTNCPSGYFADNNTGRCLQNCLIVPSTYRFN
jgi:hypothetical protein